MPKKPRHTLYMRAYRNGMSVEEMENFFDRHGRKCGICEKPWDPDKRGGGLNIDHDHTCCGAQDPSVPQHERPARLCGKCARGLLCTACNAAIGQFGDRIDLLEAAVRYLKLAEEAIDE